MNYFFISTKLASKPGKKASNSFMSSNAIVLSIRPQYATKIFKGTKTVELRRVRPKYIKKGDLVLIYVSSPIQSLAGAFKVDNVIEKSLQELWELMHDKAGITRDEFDDYYDGVSTGVGIFFSEVWPLREPIKLQDLKEQVSFCPPQGFRYVTANELASPQLAEFMGGIGMVMQSALWNEETEKKISD